MRKYVPFLLLLFCYCIIMGLSHSADLEEGLAAGREAFEALQGRTFGEKLNQRLGTEEMQAILNQSPDTEVLLDPSAIPNKSASEMIRDSVNQGGKKY